MDQIHIEGDFNCVNCKEVGKLIELNESSTILPCIILKTFIYLNNEVNYLFDTCIKKHPNDSFNLLNSVVKKLHDLEFDVIYETRMLQDNVGAIIRNTFQFDGEAFVIGKLWITQKITNEHVIDCTFEELLENSELMNKIGLSPTRVHLLIICNNQESRVKSLVQKIYFNNSSFQGLFIPTILENPNSINKTTDKNSSNTLKNSSNTRDLELDHGFNNVFRNFCIYFNETNYQLGFIVTFLIIYRSKLFCNTLCKLFNFINFRNYLYTNELYEMASIFLNSCYDIWRLTFSIIFRINSPNSLLSKTIFPLEHISKPEFPSKYVAFYSIQFGIIITSSHFYMRLHRKLSLIFGTLISSIEMKNRDNYRECSGTHNLNQRLWTVYILQNRKIVYLIINGLHVLSNLYKKRGDSYELKWIQIIEFPGFVELINILRDINRTLCNQANKCDSITIYHPKSSISMDLIKFGGLIPTWLDYYCNETDNSFTVFLNLPTLEIDPRRIVSDDPALFLFYGSLCAEFQILIKKVCKNRKIIVSLS